jgi:hypothetical protein
VASGTAAQNGSKLLARTHDVIALARLDQQRQFAMKSLIAFVKLIHAVRILQRAILSLVYRGLGCLFGRMHAVQVVLDAPDVSGADRADGGF